jgi:hypothetical protein
MKTHHLLSLALAFATSLAISTSAQAATPDETRAIAKDAYVYGYPLVDNYRIQHSYFIDRGGPEYKATWNTLYNNARVYTPDDKAIQTPNSDTPYSYAGADLRAEPLVLTVPAIEKGRYYSLQFIDQYTFNFAYVGSRATGNDAGSFLLTGPKWKGEKPKGIKAVIPCETEFAFVLYRTQLFDPADIENVKKIQAGYKVQTLSSFLGKPAPIVGPDPYFPKPLTPEQQHTSAEFFRIMDFVLSFCPTHPSEKALRGRITKLGVDSDKLFETENLTPEIRNALEEGMADGQKAIMAHAATLTSSADGFGTREFLNGNYLVRATAAQLGIYGNSKDEAFYVPMDKDTDGKPLDGTKHYTLRFAPGQLPPVNAFWSLTMYELPSRLLVANPLKRYLINSRMLPALKKDADGGITLYVQHESPGADKEANWLPAPASKPWLVMRLYLPKPEVLNGGWKAPALQKAP